MNLKINTKQYPKTLALKITLQNDINAVLYYSLPLCILLADEKLIPWYYENFIEIFSYNYLNLNKEFLVLTYLCDYNTGRYSTNFYAHLADEICLGYDLLELKHGITPFMIEHISKGYYIIVYLDEYYLPEKVNYRKRHFVHESLIYGYDDRRQKFMAIGFDDNNSFRMMEFDYRLVSKAFAEGKLNYKINYNGIWAETMAVRLIKPYEFSEEYPLDLKRYLAKLTTYLFPEEEPARIYPFRIQNEGKREFGINIYNAVIYQFKNILKGKLTISFKELHFLYEHKKYIYQSLNYINDKFKLGDVFEILIKKYFEVVVRAMDDIRLIFLKNTYMKKKNLKFVDEMIRIVEKTRNEEKDVLLEIITVINNAILLAENLKKRADEAGISEKTAADPAIIT